MFNCLKSALSIMVVLLLLVLYLFHAHFDRSSTVEQEINENLLLRARSQGRSSSFSSSARAHGVLGGESIIVVGDRQVKRQQAPLFESHYLAIYKSMILLRERPPKFVVFQMSPLAGLGFGNRVRSLSGAIFLAALTDRVLLLDESSRLKRRKSTPQSFHDVFRPPIVDGVELDWSVELAGGLCSKPNASATIPSAPDDLLDNFEVRFDGADCIVITAAHGHDRQIVSRNEAQYRDKVMRLFGTTSRFEWSSHTLGLLMQRPNPDIAEAAASVGNHLGLDAVPASHRLAIQYRTFADMGTSKALLELAASKFWNCTLNLVDGWIADIRKKTYYPYHPSRPAANPAIHVIVFFSSDNQEMQGVAQQRLGGIPGLTVVSSDVPITHSGGAMGKMKKATGVDGAGPFVDWFLIGNCSALIASGASSFAVTAFFRPSLTAEGANVVKKKRLFTVDQIDEPHGDNPSCGEIVPRGYNDINMGFRDSKIT